MNARELVKELKKMADPERSEVSRSFFKTYDGGYGAGDVFLGLTVPVQRIIAKKYIDLTFKDVKELLLSKIHEHRFIGLEILVFKYEKGDENQKKKVVEFYLKNRERVNNWDLVDTSAPYILGDWLRGRDRKILYDLTGSESVWDRRIAIVSTYAFIREGDLGDTFNICELLLRDEHDLIHKACGWMLREAGKKSESDLIKFLDEHYKCMPRTMLRYAIERFPVAKRKEYLKRSSNNL